MATKGEPSVSAALVQQHRKRLGLTAEQLAARVPSEEFTKTVVTNLESGRKKDLSAAELLQVASALRVPPTLLLVPVAEPFAPVPVAGLADPFASMCIAEFLCAAGVDPSLDALPHATRSAMATFSALIELDHRVHDHALLEDFPEEWRRELEVEPGTSVTMWVDRPDGSELLLDERSLSDDAWFDRLHALGEAANALSRQMSVTFRKTPAPDWLIDRARRAVQFAERELSRAGLVEPESPHRVWDELGVGDGPSANAAK